MMWAIKHKSGRVLFVTSDEFIADNRRKMGWIVEEMKMTSREQFEKFIMSVAGNVSMQTFMVHDSIYYKDAHIQGMWRAWKASREAIEIDLSNMHLLLCDQNDVVDELIKHGIKSKVNP